VQVNLPAEEPGEEQREEEEEEEEEEEDEEEDEESAVVQELCFTQERLRTKEREVSNTFVSSGIGNVLFPRYNYDGYCLFCVYYYVY